MDTSDVLSPRALDEWTFIDEPTDETVPCSTSEALLEALEAAHTKAVATQTSTASSAPAAAASTEEEVPEGCQRIRVRIGETVQTAYFKATQGVEQFTTQVFANALTEGKRIRLIYMGMLLMQDRTMGEYGIEEDGVIHAVITEAPPSPHVESTRDVELKGLSNPANSLLATTGLALYGLWTLLYHFPHLFSWKAIVLLALLSLVHITATVQRVSA